jgi:hypothetical protein
MICSAPRVYIFSSWGWYVQIPEIIWWLLEMKCLAPNFYIFVSQGRYASRPEMICFASKDNMLSSQNCYVLLAGIIVPDSKSRNIPEVFLVRRWAGGIRGFGGEGLVGWRLGQIGSVYKQPETEVDDSCHSWRVPSKWKGTQRGGKG